MYHGPYQKGDKSLRALGIFKMLSVMKEVKGKQISFVILDLACMYIASTK